jgi:hypothetical protein
VRGLVGWGFCVLLAFGWAFLTSFHDRAFVLGVGKYMRGKCWPKGMGACFGVLRGCMSTGLEPCCMGNFGSALRSGLLLPCGAESRWLSELHCKHGPGSSHNGHGLELWGGTILCLLAPCQALKAS